MGYETRIAASRAALFTPSITTGAPMTGSPEPRGGLRSELAHLAGIACACALGLSACAAEIADENRVASSSEALGLSGTLDPTFGNGGKVTTLVNVGAGGVSAQLQPDGKIIAAATVQDLVVGNP